MTPNFPDNLDFEDAGMVGGSRIFRLLARFRFMSCYGTVTAPKNFLTDCASVPRIFWNIFSPIGEYMPAAIIHDWLYSKLNDEFTRKESDEIFLDGMKCIGVGFIKRMTIYSAVRAFGGSSFKGTTLK